MKSYVAFDDSVKVLDMYLLTLAKNRYKKEILPLETPELQMNALTAGISDFKFSYKFEIDLLMNYVENWVKLDSTENAVFELHISNYLNQDLSLYSDMNRKPIFQYRLVDNRNNQWMEKIPDLIQAKSCFIAVGAAHLVNERGLINQLRKLGYSVERIE